MSTRTCDKPPRADNARQRAVVHDVTDAITNSQSLLTDSHTMDRIGFDGRVPPPLPTKNNFFFKRGEKNGTRTAKTTFYLACEFRLLSARIVTSLAVSLLALAACRSTGAL